MNSIDPRGSGKGGGVDILAALKSGRIQEKDAQLRAATALLEGSFYQELFKAMRGTVPEGGVISAGAGQEMFEGLLDQSIAESAALSSDRGLGAHLYRALQGGRIEEWGTQTEGEP